uniref:TLC domain-containing protein n=1 Tax=viral metagenome TaxID=1070528 RepID=A0A6C0CD75_9ZZZZ
MCMYLYIFIFPNAYPLLYLAYSIGVLCLYHFLGYMFFIFIYNILYIIEQGYK